MLHTVGEQAPNIQHLGINQEEATMNYLKDEWVSDLLNKCAHLQSLDLSGRCMHARARMHARIHA